MTLSAQQIAEVLGDLDERLRLVERGPRLASASIHGYPLPIYDSDQVLRQTLGKQDDGTYTTVDSNGPPPPVPSVPIVESRPGALVVTWDGAFADSATPPADWHHVEVHVSTTTGYATSDATEVTSIHSPKGGSVTLALNPVVHYVRLQSVNTSGVESAATAQVAGTPDLIVSESDGDEPALAPAPTVIGGIGALFVRWTPIANADPVEYEVHISKNPNFTPDYAGGGTGPEWFENFSGDLSRWPASFGNRVIDTGRAKLTTDAGVYSGIGTSTRFDMANETTLAKIEPAATPGATQQVLFTLRHDADNAFQMIKDGTNTAIICRSRVNGVNDDTTVAVTTAQVYWRFREATGTVHFEVSSNGTAWTTLHSEVHGMGAAALAAMVIEISAGDSDAGSVLPDLQVFVDDVAYGSEVLSATLATVTPGASHTIRTLPNGTPLSYEVPYFVKVVAKDADGYGPFSAEASDQMTRATNDDIAVSYIYAGTILVDQLIGGTLAADVLLGATISTRPGGVGAGVDIGPFGIVTYDSDSTPSIVLPSDADQSPIFKGEAELGGLTVTGKASLRAPDNEIATGGAVILATAVTKPQSPPTVVVDWPVFTLSGTTVDMSKVYSCTWISDGSIAGFQVTERVGATGYMIRNFDPDGSYDQTLVYEPVTSANTVYGSGFNIGTTRYIVEHITDLNWVYIRKQDGGTVHAEYYNRLNPNQLPVIGWDGTNILIAEFDATNLRFRIQTMNPTTMALTGTTMLTSVQGGFSGNLYGVVRGDFDLGASRTIVLPKNAPHAYVFNSSGTYLPNETFPVKVPDSRGLTWDGTRFWTLSAAGQLVKHAPAAWNDAHDPQTWYAPHTWYDSDAAGTGTHETDMGPVGSFQMRRRAWLTVTAPAIPDFGQPDDPDRPRFYVGKVDTARTNLWKQTDPATGVRSVTYETFTFSGTNPPAANNFPAGTPAQIKSTSGGLIIAGDGKITDPTILETVGWTTFTPTWSSSSTQPVLNNGTLAAKYKKHGRTVIATYKLTIGSTTTVGTGLYRLTLPPGLPSADNEEVAMALFLDSSASTAGYRTMSAIVETVDTLIFFYDNGTTAGAWSNTWPVTLATNDIMRVTVVYETTTN